MHKGRAGDPSSLGPEPWQRLGTNVDWNDLVLPRSALDELKEVSALLSERFWNSSPGTAPGAGERSRGMLLLFAGASGTGKTMAAQALAHELRLPVLEADLERLFARGRGEDTQLISRLFATAQRIGAVLVLDCADDLLLAARPGRRPGVTTPMANDVRDVLGRSAAYPGIVIFPSTVKHDINEATLERFDRVVEFPFPERAAREAIWRRSLGPGAAVGADDLAFIAEAFQLSGKTIAACTAAAVARAGGRPVELRHLAAALEREYGERLASASTRMALAGLRSRVGGAPAPGRAGAPPAQPGPFPEGPRRLEPVRSPEPEAAEPARSIEPAPPAAETRPTLVPAEPLPEPARARAEGSAEATARPEPRRTWITKTKLPPVAPAATEAPPAAEASPAGPPPATVPRRRKAAPRPAIPRAVFRQRLAPVALLGALAAVVVGLTASQRGSSSAAGLSLDRTASVGPVRFAYPSSWQERPAPAVSDLPLSNAVELSSTASPRGQMILGLGRTSSASPLPQAYIATHVPGTPTPQTVSLGGQRFYRVLDPRLARGSASQSVYALAAGGGALVALCDTASQAFTASCERVLATVQAPTPAAAAPATNSAYAAALSAVLSTLNAARSQDARQLAGGRDPAAQAKAANALAAAHASAASAVSHLKAGSAAAANRALASALRQTSDAYAALSRAAAHSDARAYKAAQASVSQATAAITTALAQFKTLGYSVS